MTADLVLTGPLAAATAPVLPLAGQIALIVMLVAGLVVWAFGSKVVKWAFALIGLGIGGLLGSVLMPMTGVETVFGFESSTAGAVIGALIGAALAFSLFRVVIAIAAGFVFALMGLAVGMIVADFVPTAGEQIVETVGEERTERTLEGRYKDALGERLSSGVSAEIDSLREDLRTGGEDGDEEGENTRAARAAIGSVVDRTRALASSIADTITAEWNRRDTTHRAVLLAGAFGGMALGMMIGVVMPNRSAAVVTALAGAAITIGAALALSEANGVLPASFSAELSPGVLTIVWMVFAGVGVGAQIGLLRKKSSDDDDDE